MMLTLCRDEWCWLYPFEEAMDRGRSCFVCGKGGSLRLCATGCRRLFHAACSSGDSALSCPHCAPPRRAAAKTAAAAAATMAVTGAATRQQGVSQQTHEGCGGSGSGGGGSRSKCKDCRAQSANQVAKTRLQDMSELREERFEVEIRWRTDRVISAEERQRVLDILRGEALFLNRQEQIAFLELAVDCARRVPQE